MTPPLPPEALDAIEEHAKSLPAETPLANTVIRLAAEVRKLRALVAKVEGALCPFFDSDEAAWAKCWYCDGRETAESLNERSRKIPGIDDPDFDPMGVIGVTMRPKYEHRPDCLWLEIEREAGA